MVHAAAKELSNCFWALKAYADEGDVLSERLHPKP